MIYGEIKYYYLGDKFPHLLALLEALEGEDQAPASNIFHNL
jgi:hypothetical protein